MRKFSIKMLCACNPKLIDVERNLPRSRYMELIREGLADFLGDGHETSRHGAIVSSCVSKLATVSPEERKDLAETVRKIVDQILLTDTYFTLHLTIDAGHPQAARLVAHYITNKFRGRGVFNPRLEEFRAITISHDEIE
ncbi:hypothetical protein 13VO501A_gene0004 [Vibrio phage 13VO501A]|nr:hypothetical protein 13VO501A_gene0004 [Vibrio phage 13VO501A]